jgi:hypothetical protein
LWNGCTLAVTWSLRGIPRGEDVTEAIRQKARQLGYGTVP